MDPNLERILKIEVPIIVLLGQRSSTVRESLQLTPGVILEIPKRVEDELELLVNNKVIASGTAVKVGENFGLRLNSVGDVLERVQALGPQADNRPDANPDALAAEMLSAAKR